MKVKYIINNYQLTAKLKTCPVDYITSKNRVDTHHVEVIFDFVSTRQKELTDRVLAKQGTIVKVYNELTERNKL